MLRYGDDILITARTKKEAKERFKGISQLANAAGYKLKAPLANSIFQVKDGQVVDWLGFNVDLGSLEVTISESMWHKLETRLRFKVNKADDRAEKCLAITTGWLNQLYPALDCTDHEKLTKKLNGVISDLDLEQCCFDSDLINGFADSGRENWIGASAKTLEPNSYEKLISHLERRGDRPKADNSQTCSHPKKQPQATRTRRSRYRQPGTV